MNKTIAQYTIVRPLGKGGMGTVYEAKEHLSERRVALKVLRDDLEETEARRRFINEMRVLARLEHPNIVRSLACFESDGRLVIALEYLDGITLRQVLHDKGRLPWRRAAEVCLDIAHALAAAHEHAPPIIHRDIKPENVMQLVDGSIRVMDFGISKLMQSLTITQSFLGTPQYMSPEQIDGLQLTPRTDLYALGLLLFELMAGEPPFVNRSQRQLLIMQCTTPAPKLAAEMPQALRRLLYRLLEKESAARPESAAEVVLRLTSILAEGRAMAVVETSAPHSTVSSSRAKADPTPPTDTLALIDAATKPRRVFWRAIAGTIAAIALVACAVFLSGVQVNQWWANWRQSNGTRSNSSLPQSAKPQSPPKPQQSPAKPQSPPSKPPSQSRGVPRATATTVRPPYASRTTIPAFSFHITGGSVPSSASWVPAFGIDAKESSRELNYLQAYRFCRRQGQALCSESQWARACGAHNSIAGLETWTGRVDQSGFIVRGGRGSCRDRQVVVGSERNSSRAAVCCDRVIAIASSNTDMSFRLTTTHKLLKFEKAVNSRSPTIIGGLFDGEINKGRTRHSFFQFYKKRFESHPGELTHTEKCKVVLTRDVETTWSADCLTIRQHGREVSSQVIHFVRGGEAGLVQRRELVRVLRKFAPLDQ